MEENMLAHRRHPLKITLLLVIVLGLIAMGIISLVRERIVNPNRYQVSFTAEGRAFAKPDIGQVILGVRTDRLATAVAAVQDNTEKMNRVIAKLTELGIEAKDIKTTAYNLNPSYDYEPNTGRSLIKGYEVYQEATVKIRDLSKIGSTIEAVTSAGANQVGNVSFTIDDTSEVKKEARAEAVAKAQAKAGEMEELTDIKLGKLVNVYESEDSYPPVYQDYAYKSAVGMGGGGEVLEIQAGENEISLQITLVYEVK